MKPEEIISIWKNDINDKCDWDEHDILSTELTRLCSVFTRDRRYERYSVKILKDNSGQYYSTGELHWCNDGELVYYNPNKFHQISEETAMKCLAFSQIIKELQ